MRPADPINIFSGFFQGFYTHILSPKAQRSADEALVMGDPLLFLVQTLCK
jgi:hypothetical protein